MVKSPASHPTPQDLLKLACVVGARPNFIKMAALIAEFRRRPSFDVRLIHTGQHFSPEMSQAFFDDLELPAPDLNLEVSGGKRASATFLEDFSRASSFATAFRSRRRGK